MRLIRVIALWCGSDWRLFVFPPLVVLATFILSGNGYDCIKSSHERYLKWNYDRKQAKVMRSLEQLDRERARRQAPQIAGASLPSVFGL